RRRLPPSAPCRAPRPPVLCSIAPAASHALSLHDALPILQLIMGIGTAEELARAEVKAEEAMKRTVVQGRDADPEPAEPLWEAKCPFTGQTLLRPRRAGDPIVWTDRKSTRLNSSHVKISYAVFCLK